VVSNQPKRNQKKAQRELANERRPEEHKGTEEHESSEFVRKS
jgi:hypothetical protein